MNKLTHLYEKLYDLYGPQGWWPILHHNGTNPTKTGSHSGYHVNDFSFPRNENEKFEIAVGAVLTQNTAWTNVELALTNLSNAGVLHSPELLLNAEIDQLKEAIRPAGYFNQKSNYLRNLASFFLSNEPFSRKNLLSIKGVGEETADAILLYACGTPSFVIDAYTKRCLTTHGILTGNEQYRYIQSLFHESIKPDVDIYQEYHALFVEHGKRFFSKKPYGDNINIL